jgi:hypothetical protein
MHSSVDEIKVRDTPVCNCNAKYAIEDWCLTDVPVQHWQVVIGPCPAETNLNAGSLHGGQSRVKGIMAELLSRWDYGIHLKKESHFCLNHVRLHKVLCCSSDLVLLELVFEWGEVEKPIPKPACHQRHNYIAQKYVLHPGPLQTFSCNRKETVINITITSVEKDCFFVITMPSVLL